MLDFMRRQRSNLKWVWVVIIFIFSVTLITLYIPVGDLPNVSITNDVASVGNQNISAREFQAAYRNYVDRMRGQITPEMMRAFRFDRQIMDSLIDRYVVVAEAERLGFKVTPAEVEERILENAVFRENGTFIGRARYQAILAQNNLTVEDFEAAIANELLTDKLRSFVTASIAVADQDVEQEYKRRNEKVKLDYFVIDASKLQDKVTVSEQDERDYYEKNKAKYTVPEKRKAKYIFLESLKLRAQVKVTDDDLRQYYAQHKDEYTLPERVKAQHILFKTKAKLLKKPKKSGRRPEVSSIGQRKARISPAWQSSFLRTQRRKPVASLGTSAAAKWFRSSNNPPSVSAWAPSAIWFRPSLEFTSSKSTKNKSGASVLTRN